MIELLDGIDRDIKALCEERSMHAAKVLREAERFHRWERFYVWHSPFLAAVGACGVLVWMAATDGPVKVSVAAFVGLVLYFLSIGWWVCERGGETLERIEAARHWRDHGTFRSHWEAEWFKEQRKRDEDWEDRITALRVTSESQVRSEFERIVGR